ERGHQAHPHRHRHLAERRKQHHHRADAREHHEEGRRVSRQEGDVDLHRLAACRPQPEVMRAATRAMCPLSASPMNGSATSSARKIARIFGTKASVISWIWVSACNSEMATPTASPTSISGLATMTRV